jgi:hypothetical protein
LYARRYSPTQWKKNVIGFDLLNLAPWNARIAAVTNDLDFYDLLVEYVSDLQDAHDQYLLPTDFEAYLGFSSDIYDGKVMIDFIDRDTLDPTAYPFQVGDQLISVDGQAALDLVKKFSKYVTGANPRTVQRFAAELITDRIEAEYPYATQVGDTATVVILRQNGNTETYNIPWTKIGTPLTSLGASPGPTMSLQKHVQTSSSNVATAQQMMRHMENFTFTQPVAVVGFGSQTPVFALPTNFVQRLSTKNSDWYFSGTYAASDGTRIGYLRIPKFIDDLGDSPDLVSLDREIKFFQTNTDVLVVDIMRNGGGLACSGSEAILSRLTPNPFQGASEESRVDWTDLWFVNFALQNPDLLGLTDDQIAQYQLFQPEYQNAFYNNQGRTKALPICGSTTNRTPQTFAYTKPVLLLTDEMSASAADLFAALAQDNHVATLFGYRTMGAGGSPEDGDPVGVYTEGTTNVTRSMLTRLQPVSTPDFPTTNYIENVGVRPDIVMDYMTVDNLVNQGATFVQAFTNAAVKLAKGGK